MAVTDAQTMSAPELPPPSVGGWARSASLFPTDAWVRPAAPRLETEEGASESWVRPASLKDRQESPTHSRSAPTRSAPTRRAAIEAERHDDTPQGWTWRHVAFFVAALAIALTLFFVVRSVVQPSKPARTSVEQSAPASTTFPETVAASVAEHFGNAYFTWDSSDPDARASAFAGLVQDGLGSSLGWNGTGKSSGANARLDALQLVTGSTARATVTVTVSTAGKSGAGSATQQTIEIPLVADRGHVFVSGVPATVATDAPSKAASKETAVKTDAGATDETKAAAATFFAEYGAETELSATVADGSGIRGLGGALRFDGLVSWKAARDSGTFHAGYATVSWKTASGSVLEQRYRVGMAKTGTERQPWQVLNVAAVTAPAVS